MGGDCGCSRRSFLNAARQVAFIAAGAAKAPILKAISDGVPDVALPCSLIRPAGGMAALHWFIDVDAAAELQTTGPPGVEEAEEEASEEPATAPEVEG